MLCQASCVHCGANNRKMDDGPIERTNCGLESGVSSIGLNPATVHLNSIFPDLSKLKEKVKERVCMNKDWRNQLGNHDFNSVSVKVYYSYNEKQKQDGKPTMVNAKKEVNWHTDIELNKDGKPMSNKNSQVPKTPVAILTIGDPK